MTPSQRRLVGIILLVFGVVSLAMGGMVVGMTVKARAASAARFTETQESCKVRLKALGGEVSEVPGRIIWMKGDIEQAPARIGEASVASVLCPGWQLKTACVGRDCSESGSMRVVLEPMTDGEGSTAE
jgi:hypothetical protein